MGLLQSIKQIKTVEWFSIAGLFLSALGLLLVCMQLEQSNEHKRWENYNSLNLRYYEWYSKLTETDDIEPCTPFEKQPQKIKRLVRTYFNLYSEEYWLYQNELIPEEMWTERINNGVEVNLSNYPILIEGYKYWKEKGALNHPSDFSQEVDKKLASIKTHKCK